MARKIIEQIVSDLSGDEMPVGKGQTVDFTFRGTSYTIDLTDKEAAGFDKSIAMYIEHATKVSASRSRKPTATKGGSGRTKEELAEAREWLKTNGYEVADRGRVKQELLDLYDAR